MCEKRIVILGNGTEWLRYCLMDAQKRSDVVFINDLFPCKRKLLKRIIRIHYTRRVRFPFKTIWNKLLMRNILDIAGKADEYVFIVYDWNRLGVNGPFLKMLKKKLKAKLVYVFTNIIEITYAYITRFVEKLKDYYDLVYAFDAKDSEKYGFELNQLIYSRLDISDVNYTGRVFFAGSAKDRLPDLIKTYDRLNDLGIKCNFHIINVPKDDIVLRDGITYNLLIPYEEVVRETMESSCLVEFKQGGSSALTIKVCEAIFYDKLLITTNQSIKNYPFYDERFMFVIDKPENIEISFFENAGKVKYSEEAKDYFSLNTFLNRVMNYIYGGQYE